MKAAKKEAIKMQKLKDLDRWTDEKYLQLFALIEAEPCLWRRSDPYHSKRYMTNAVTKKIADALQCPPTEVQARWRSMRQTFFKYLQKEKQFKSGSGVGTKSKEWRFMGPLRFLQCEITEAKSTDILKFEEDTHSKSECSVSDVSMEYTPKMTKKNADQLHNKAVYSNYAAESFPNQDDEFVEKGSEIGNALRRIAKRNSNMADELYIAIRRMILDKEENLHKKTGTSPVCRKKR